MEVFSLLRRISSLFLAVWMLLCAGCGGGSSPSASTGSSQDPAASLTLQDPSAFLTGTALEASEPGSTGIRKLTFTLEAEEDVLALQYAQLLLNGAYPLEQADRVESENDDASAWACYYRYTGEGELNLLDMEGADCHLFLGIRRDNGEKTTVSLIYPTGVSFADWGARADRTAIPPAPTPGSDAGSISPEDPRPLPLAVEYPDPGAFLHGRTPDTDRPLDNGAAEQLFVLEKGRGALGRQYVAALMAEPYALQLTDAEEITQSKVVFEYYYLHYTGSLAVGTLEVNGKTCHLCVRVSNYENRNETHIQVVTADGFRAVDPVRQADLNALGTARPIPNPPAPPAVTPTRPTIDLSDPAVIPDFLDYDPTGAFRAGTSSYDHAVCFLAAGVDYYDTAEGYVRLLQDRGYRVTKTDNKIKRTYGRYQWNLYHDGLDLDTIEDDTYVRVKFLYRHNDGDPKTEISIGYAIGITYAGDEQYKGGGGGSSTGGGSWDPYVPDHAKLPCLDCDGSGDCDECGGYGYVGFGDARAACGRCHRSGDCRTCGGSGTR